jgi:hypothetical protein
MADIEDATVRVLPPPPIQGIGFAAGFTFQIELADNSMDFTKLASVVDTTVANTGAQSHIGLVMSSFRANIPQYTIEVDRVKAQSLQVNVDQVLPRRRFLGRLCQSVRKFGQTFEGFVQADSISPAARSPQSVGTQHCEQHNPAHHADQYHASLVMLISLYNSTVGDDGWNSARTFHRRRWR